MSSQSTQVFQYAQVQFFFLLPIYTHQYGLVQFLLVLITLVSIIEREDLFKIDGRKTAKITIINIDNIVRVVGLVRRKKKTHIIY